MCRRLVAWDGNPYRPFCSQRCQVHDLGNWASERYCVPDKTVGCENDDEADADESDRINPSARRH
ncbi:MAG: DNA gyrase inhibitor YacG [Deltaproteobacteria bacterium]|nr:DNA gyrase inhibitor YacG [Planctomycetota bacterium]MBI3782896.1 DNA gyrase inhibitor YacG [Deltaproteobacteria bacterium]